MELSLIACSIQPGWLDAQGPSVPDGQFDGADWNGSTALVVSERMGRGVWLDRCRSFIQNGRTRLIGVGRHAEQGSSGPRVSRNLDQ